MDFRSKCNQNKLAYLCFYFDRKSTYYVIFGFLFRSDIDLKILVVYLQLLRKFSWWHVLEGIITSIFYKVDEIAFIFPTKLAQTSTLLLTFCSVINRFIEALSLVSEHTVGENFTQHQISSGRMSDLNCLLDYCF